MRDKYVRERFWYLGEEISELKELVDMFYKRYQSVNEQYNDLLDLTCNLAIALSETDNEKFTKIYYESAD